MKKYTDFVISGMLKEHATYYKKARLNSYYGRGRRKKVHISLVKQEIKLFILVMENLRKIENG